MDKRRHATEQREPPADISRRTMHSRSRSSKKPTIKATGKTSRSCSAIARAVSVEEEACRRLI
jgi:hypothetical protein